MSIHLTAIFAIVFFLAAALVINYYLDAEQEPALSDEDQDRAQHYAMYRESFRALALAVVWTVVAVAFVGYSIFTY